MTGMSSRLKAVILLTLTTFFWGLTFVYVKEGTAAVGVYSFLLLRFLIAALSLHIMFIRRFRRPQAKTFRTGILLGALLALSYILQTEGLQTSSAVNAAFITGLFVVFVPLISPWFSRIRPLRIHIVSAGISLTGLFLITGIRAEQLVSGDLLVLGCAVTFALYVVLVGNLKPGFDSIQLTVSQLYTVVILSGAGLLLKKEALLIPEGRHIWWTVVFCALFATSFSYAVEIRFQRYLTDTQAALIYSLEPVFASAAAVYWLGEKITVPMAAGSFLIISAMLLSATHVQRKVEHEF